MQLDFPYPTTSKANRGNTLELPPAPNTELLPQTRDLADRTADGNPFDLRDSPIISKYIARHRGLGRRQYEASGLTEVDDII